MTAKVNGAVLVVGGGIAGIQAALNLADSGYKVYLAERRAAIGGVMAILDKTLGTEGPLKGRAEILIRYTKAAACAWPPAVRGPCNCTDSTIPKSWP